MLFVKLWSALGLGNIFIQMCDVWDELGMFTIFTQWEIMGKDCGVPLVLL